MPDKVPMLTRAQYPEWYVQMKEKYPNRCWFCHPETQPVLKEYQEWYWIQNPFPYAHGGMLFYPKRHITWFYELTSEELVHLGELHEMAKHICEESNLKYADGTPVVKYWLQIHDYAEAHNYQMGKTPRIHHFHIHFSPVRAEFLAGWHEDGAELIDLTKILKL